MALVPGTEPAPGDLVVEKVTMSAPEPGQPASDLRGAGIDTRVDCGAWTTTSVEQIDWTAADKGGGGVGPEVACFTLYSDLHRVSVDRATQNVATGTDVASVEEAFS